MKLGTYIMVTEPIPPISLSVYMCNLPIVDKQRLDKMYPSFSC
jgi:hypothetical protein